MSTDGEIRERFRFSDFDEWSDTLAGDIEVFKQVHRIMPNVLAASREVYAEMDQAAQSHRELVVNEAGRHPGKNTPFEISSFLLEDSEVVFVVTDTVPFPEYTLIYDPEPEFDDEPAGIPGTNI